MTTVLLDIEFHKARMKTLKIGTSEQDVFFIEEIEKIARLAGDIIK